LEGRYIWTGEKEKEGNVKALKQLKTWQLTNQFERETLQKLVQIVEHEVQIAVMEANRKGWLVGFRECQNIWRKALKAKPLTRRKK